MGSHDGIAREDERRGRMGLWIRLEVIQRAGKLVSARLESYSTQDVIFGHSLEYRRNRRQVA
jgi:hypothetical protein